LIVAVIPECWAISCHAFLRRQTCQGGSNCRWMSRDFLGNSRICLRIRMIVWISRYGWLLCATRVQRVNPTSWIIAAILNAREVTCQCGMRMAKIFSRSLSSRCNSNNANVSTKFYPGFGLRGRMCVGSIPLWDSLFRDSNGHEKRKTFLISFKPHNQTRFLRFFTSILWSLELQRLVTSAGYLPSLHGVVDGFAHASKWLYLRLTCFKCQGSRIYSYQVVLSVCQIAALIYLELGHIWCEIQPSRQSQDSSMKLALGSVSKCVGSEYSQY
jgi:hypothetical protein